MTGFRILQILCVSQESHKHSCRCPGLRPNDPILFRKKLGVGWCREVAVMGEGVTICRITALPCGHSCKLHLSQCPKRNHSSAPGGTHGGLRASGGTFPRSAECPSPLASQTPLSMVFSRQEYWSGLPCPPLRIFLTQGSTCTSYISCIRGQVLCQWHLLGSPL